MTPTSPATPPTPAELEALAGLALACDSPGLARALAELEPSALAQLGPEVDASVRLLGRWHARGGFTAQGQREPEAVAELIAALTAELGREPPAWWSALLASGRRTDAGDAGPAAYDLQVRDDGDRRGPLEDGPGGVRVRPGVAPPLTASAGALAYDLSIDRVELGPIPDPPGVVELARAPGSSTIYYASFDPAAGGARFPLAAVAGDGQRRWTAEVCGPDRQGLGGLGYLITQIVILADPSGAKPGTMAPAPEPTGIAVFTGESHGVAVEVFDPSTGARILAWSAELRPAG